MQSAPPASRSVAEWYREKDLNAGTPVAGSYEVVDGAASAVLNKAWDDEVAPPYLAGDASIPVLYGHLPRDGQVTLVDLRLKSGGAIFGSPLIETVLRSSYAVEGVWLPPGDLMVTEVRVAFWDQESWTDWRGFAANLETRPRSIVVEPPPPTTAQVGGATVTLRDASTIHPEGWPANGYRLESASNFHLAFERPVSFKEMFADWLMPLEFLILTSSGRTSGLEKVKVFNPAWGLDPRDDWPQVHRRFAPRPTRPPDWYERLHRLSDFDFARQVPLLFDVVRANRYSANQYAGLRSDNFSGLLERFAAASQLAESFDRHLHESEDQLTLNDPSRVNARIANADDVERALRAGGFNSDIRRRVKQALRGPEDVLSHQDRLHRLDREAGSVISRACRSAGFDPEKGEDWARDLACLRNMTVHGTPEANALFKDGNVVYAATQLYLWLFEAAWLNAVGFDQQTINERVMIRFRRRQDLIEAAHDPLRALVVTYADRRRSNQ